MIAWSGRHRAGPPKLTAEELLSLIEGSVHTVRENRPWFYSKRDEDPIKLLPECFTIVEFGPTKRVHDEGIKRTPNYAVRRIQRIP